MEVKLELGHTAWKNIKPNIEGYTHDWIVFVRGVSGNEIKHIVEKVIFHLPDSYEDSKRIREESPFAVSESTSQGISIRIDVFFCTEAKLGKVNYTYDIQISDEVVNTSLMRILTFPNPSKEFREKLFLAGGELVDLQKTLPVLSGGLLKCKAEPDDEIIILDDDDKDMTLNTTVQELNSLQELLVENENPKSANAELKEKIGLHKKAMEQMIARALPLIELETVKKISERLTEIGVMSEEDLEFVEMDNIEDLLKPIQAKKLMKFFKSIEKTNSSSDLNKVLSETTSSTDSAPSQKESSSSFVVSPVVSLAQNCEIPWGSSDLNKVLSETTSNIDSAPSQKESPGSFVVSSVVNWTQNFEIPWGSSDLNEVESESTSFTDPAPSQEDSTDSFVISLDDNWAQKFEIPWNSFPKEVMDACLRKTHIKKKYKCEMIRILAGEIMKIDPCPGRKKYRIIAEKIVSKYPDTFQDRCGKIVVAGGYSSIMRNIEDAVDNRKRRNRLETDIFAICEAPSTKKSRTMQSSYGTVNWQPNELPINETKDSQHDRKEFLIKEYSKGKLDSEKVEDSMVKTFASQRYFINNSTNNISDIKREWPFLLEEKYMLLHYQMLMNQDIYKLFLETIPVKGKKICDFMVTKAFVPAIAKCLIDIKAAKQVLGNGTPEAIGSFLLLMTYFREEKEILFQTFKNARNATEVEAKCTQSTPFIGVLCENLCVAKEYIIFIDGKAVACVNNFIAAISVLFAAFYNFNILYPVGASTTMEFVQRCFAGINPERGSKAERKQKKKVGPVSLPVLRLIEELNSFESIA